MQDEYKPKPFRIELGWRGMFGLVVVCFFLFLWLFLLGMWAGQTIVFPSKPSPAVQREYPSSTASELDKIRRDIRR
jgi:hypothetical protein